MMSLLAALFPTSAFTKGTLHASPDDFATAGCMSLRWNKMERGRRSCGEAVRGNAQQHFVANRNADEYAKSRFFCECLQNLWLRRNVEMLNSAMPVVQ